MARLRNLIKMDGALGSTSTEEVSKLAARQGRTAAPTTPLETSVIGGNEDQAKMARTPNQRIGALRQTFAASTADSLADAQRRGPVTPTTQAPQSDVKRAQLDSIMGLGEIGERLRGIALRRFQEQEEAQAQQVELDLTDLDVTEEQQAALDAIRAGTPKNEDWRIAAEALLGEGAGAQMAIDDIQAAISSRIGGDAAGQAAGQAAGRIKLGELSQEDLAAVGFDNFDQMAEQFDMDAEQLQALSLTQMQDLLDSKQAAQFDRAAELRSTLADPNVTQAEREAAQAELKQLGLSGEQDVEREYADLERQVREGRTIEFAGEQVDVERVLDDEYIKSKAKLLLEDEEYRDELYETDREFVEFVEGHQQAFDDLTAEIDESATEFVKLQETNIAKAKPNEGMVTGFSNDVMSQWYEDWGDIKSDEYQDVGIIEMMRDLSPEDAQAMEMAINSFAEAGDTDLLKELGTLTKDELLKLGFTNAKQVENYRTSQQMAREIDDYDLNNKEDLATFTNKYLGADSIATLEKRLSDAMALNSSGFGRATNSQLKLLDADGDGKLDKIGDIVNRLKNKSGGSLKDLLKQNKTLAQVSTPTISSFNVELPKNKVFLKVMDYFRDGKVSRSEAQEMAKNLSGDELAALYSKQAKGMNKDANVEILKKIRSDADKRASDHYKHWIGEVRKTTTIPKDLNGQPLQVDRPEDILNAAARFKAEIDRLRRELAASPPVGSSPQATQNWRNLNLYIDEHTMRLDMLKTFSKELARNTTGLGEDTSWEKSAIRQMSDKLRNL